MARNQTNTNDVSIAVPPKADTSSSPSPPISPLNVAIAAGALAITAALYSISKHFIRASKSPIQQQSTSTAASLSSTDRDAINSMAPLLLAAETAAGIDETEHMSTEELESLEMNLRMLITSMEAQLSELQDDLISTLSPSAIEELDAIAEQRSYAEDIYTSSTTTTSSSSSSSSASLSSVDIEEMEKKLSDLHWTEFQILTSNAADEDKRMYRSLLFNKSVQSHLLRQVERRLASHNKKMKNGELRSTLHNNNDSDSDNTQQQQQQQSTTTTNNTLSSQQSSSSPSFPASSITTTTTTTTTPSIHLAIAGFSIPHPRKSTTGGEDAFFINEQSNSFGVADGVGGWVSLGIDPSIYPKLLMTQCREYSTESKDPLKILQQSFERAHAPGSCTVAIATLDNNVLRLVSLGDCGIRIVRHGRVVLSTDIQEHKFNQPYQLASPQHHTANVPEDALQYEFVVQRGDVIVMATDGLWDNIWNDELIEVMDELSPETPSVGHASKTLCEVAAVHALDDMYRSPFAEEKHERTVPQLLRGVVKGSPGGKPDDITSVIALVL